jgi:D-lactate dehydrogenase (cytochrome)
MHFIACDLEHANHHQPYNRFVIVPVTRAARDGGRRAPLVTDPDVLAGVLADASHLSGGHAAGVVFARTEADVAAVLETGTRVLPIGAQSSVTGGATPFGETVLSTARMARILAVERDRVRVEPGVTVGALQEALAVHGRLYPPAPTYAGACVGGTVATNAAGAATFRYGSTRGWVEALTVVLPGSDVLDVPRGAYLADDQELTIRTSRGLVRIPVPSYDMPAVPKRSAGYHAERGMGLIDLFIGSEGTLGIITEVTLRTVQPAPAPCLALVQCPSTACALEIVAALAADARSTWRSRDARGLDVSAIEHIDRRSIAILREDGADRRAEVRIAPHTDTLLLVQIDLPAGTGAASVYDQIASAAGSGGDGALVRFCHMLDVHGLLDSVQIAAPGDARMAQFMALREAVPAGVNSRVARAQPAADARISKTAGDMIVPLDRFGEMLRLYDERFSMRGLEYAVWGHASDGNVHPNVIPRSYADVEAGREALLDLGRDAVRLGGCPLAEHGVGRNAVKQALLRQMYGDAGIAEMRAVKRAIDPGWTLAPGVIFGEDEGW